MKENGHPYTNGEPESGQPVEAVVARLLFDRLQKDNWLVPGDREAIAYRVAEIMVLAKDLYTQTLPRLMGKSEEKSTLSFQDELAGLRMALLHMRDLVGDFDAAYLDAMTHEREIDPESVADWVNPEDWDPDDLADEV